jgi:hypothetical protein
MSNSQSFSWNLIWFFIFWDNTLIHLFLHHAMQIKDLISISAESYTRGQMLVMVWCCILPILIHWNLVSCKRDSGGTRHKYLASRIRFSSCSYWVRKVNIFPGWTWSVNFLPCAALLHICMLFTNLYNRMMPTYLLPSFLEDDGIKYQYILMLIYLLVLVVVFSCFVFRRSFFLRSWSFV